MLVVACFVGIPTCYSFPHIILVSLDLGSLGLHAGLLFSKQSYY
jgi:hypothetical protein